MRIMKSDDDFTSAVPPNGVKAVARNLRQSEISQYNTDEFKNTAVFGTLCPCGSETFVVKEEDTKIFLVCVLCGYTFVIYDGNRHGTIIRLLTPRNFDPEISHACSVCGSDHSRIILLYAYPESFDTLLLGERKQEDAFKKVSLIATCAQCGHTEKIIEKNC